MADNHSQTPSTIAPGDSASSSGRKKKPGKAERAQRRSQVGSTAGQPASAAKAAAFASGMDEIRPQPGKFPVVFTTGAGEPSRDKTFSLNGDTMFNVMTGLTSRFVANPKYAEFKAHSEIDDSQFQKNLISSALLRLAQQLVHSHVNMGLPQGDFAPVASSDVKVPSSVAAYLSQYGEFSVPALGTRFLLSGYEDSVKRVVWAADQVSRIGPNGALFRLWLPMSQSDLVTKSIIADRLKSRLRLIDIDIPATVLEGAVLSGIVPDAWEGIKGFLGDEPAEGKPDSRDRFDFLFKSYADTAQFTVAFTSATATPVLGELNLAWPNPSAGHLDWSYNVKSAFTRLADTWAKLSAAYAQFFELSSSQSVRSSVSGSQSQMAQVTSVEGVTVIKTHLALSAPEFSLTACFPTSCVFSDGLTRNVVVTTPLSVSQRATEFCQLDWR